MTHKINYSAPAIVMVCCALWLLSFSSLAAADFAVDNERIDTLLDRHMQDSGLPGMAVGIFQGGEIAYSEAKGVDGYGEQLTATTPMFIGSLSKSFTALAVMQLAEAGLISLDVPVQNYIPYFEVADRALSGKITVRDLLVQKSGLSRTDSIPSSAYSNTLEERVRALSSMDNVADRGEEFHYLNDNYNILGLLIEEVTDTSYASYMENNIFLPLGMNDTTADYSAIQQTKRQGYTSIFGFSKTMRQRVPRYDIPSGYIVSNLRDMNNYVAFLLDPDERILSEEGIETMRTAGENSDYGMGWHIEEVDDQTVIKHSGAVPAFSAHIELRPETKSGYVYLINKNHLIFNFVKTYATLNANLSQLVRGGEDFAHFPSQWIIRIVSLVILLLAGKDIWATVKLMKSKREKKKWYKEGVKSLLLILFLSAGLPFLLKHVLSLGFDLTMMLSYAPDFTLLLMLAILIQVVRMGLALVRVLQQGAHP